MDDPRQSTGDAATALRTAITMFHAKEQEYRNAKGPQSQRMDKTVRRRLAAEYADWARALEAILHTLPIKDQP